MKPTRLNASLFTSGSPEDRRIFADNLISGLKADGFAMIKNHGIPAELLCELFEHVCCTAGKLLLFLLSRNLGSILAPPFYYAKKSSYLDAKQERLFFDLPIGVKRACAHQGGTRPKRGYNGYSVEKSWKISPGNENLHDATDARVSRSLSTFKPDVIRNQ